MSFKLIDVPHRHCVFTIAEELRPFFLTDRTLINCLFSAVRSVVLRLFHSTNKSECFTPGFLCVLHTSPSTAGMTADEIRIISDDDLLDMDYFLNEEDFDFGEAGEEGFYIF